MTQKRRSFTSSSTVTSSTTAEPEPCSSTPVNEDVTITGSSDHPSSIKSIQQRLQSTSDASAKYASTGNLIQFVKFFTANTGDILVAKQGEDAELILRGVYQIARNNFFFTPDGNFDPDNTLNTRFKDAKLNCRLIAPSSSSFRFAQDDFPSCIDNLLALERMVKHDKSEEIMSTVYGSKQGMQPLQFKLSHSLFEVKPMISSSDSEDNESETNPDTETIASANANDELGEDFAMESWPVSPRCSAHLQQLLPTHNICPLPAYDIKGQPIPPFKYESSLKGATVEVHFAFVHHHFKKHKRHVYNALLRKLQVLQAPDAIPSSPFKKLRVSADNSKRKYRAPSLQY